MGTLQNQPELEEPTSQAKQLLAPPHVVILCIPAPGHTIPFTALGKVLAKEGIKVTFLSTGIVPDKVRYDLGDEAEREKLGITFRSVVEDPLLEPPHPSMLHQWLQKLSMEEMVEQAAGIITSLTPPPCCFISDIFVAWAPMLEMKLGLPRHFLITMAAGSLSFMFSVPEFAKQGLLPMEPTSSAEFVVPGVGNVPAGDVWEYFHKGDNMYPEYVIHSLTNFTQAATTATYLLNTCEEIDPSTTEALKEPLAFTGEVPKLLAIGPLLPGSDVQGGETDSLEVEKNSKSEVEKWLDDQPSGSVLYIAFGTIYSLQPEQVREIAHALEASEQRFVWIIRPPDSPLVMISKQSFKDEITALLPPGFEERTKGRGLLYSSWAPQKKILSHRAVGLFMSHCGWNSSVEAAWSSTPILASPCYVDQWMNARFVVEKAKCGVMVRDGEGKFERGHIEGLLRSMMEGEEGRVARSNMATMGKQLRDAVTPPTGSSSRNLHEYVKEIYALDKKLNHSDASSRER